MKKIILTSISAFALMLFAGTELHAQQTDLVQTNVPQEIQKYLDDNFKGMKLIKYKEEKGIDKVEHKVKLQNDTEIEFDGNYRVTDIDSKKALPASVIPSEISKYVRKNYPKNFIREWELEGTNQQVTLNNGVDLLFDMNGNFLKID